MKNDIYTYREITKKKYLDKLKRYCAYQDRCHKEVREKLEKLKVDEDIADEIIAELIKENFLNEERFARSFVRGKYRIKKWGRNKIIQHLKQKEISTYLIDRSLQEIDEEEYIANLKDLLEKKYALCKTADKYEQRKKLYRFARNKGYEHELINEILEELILY